MHVWRAVALPGCDVVTDMQWWEGMSRAEVDREIDRMGVDLRSQMSADRRLISHMDRMQAIRAADEERVRRNVARVAHVEPEEPCTCGALMNPPHDHPPRRRRLEITTDDTHITITLHPGEPRGPLPLRISLWWLRVRLWAMRARLATTGGSVVASVAMALGYGVITSLAVHDLYGFWLPILGFGGVVAVFCWWMFTLPARITLKEMS